MSPAVLEGLLSKLAAASGRLRPDERALVLQSLLPLVDGPERVRASSSEEDLFTESERALVDKLDRDTPQPLQRGPALTLIVKGTRLCNLRCSYCHDWRSGPNQTMRLPVMANVAAKALRQANPATIDVIWHGGETTMLPRRFYQRALHLQARFRTPGQRIRNELQTNATRITPEWARFFADHDIAVGVSMDGPAAIHDRYRRYVSGRGSSADVLRGIAMLREHGVDASLLMVVDEDAMNLGPRALFQFFLDAGIPRYGLLPAKPTNQPNAAPSTPTDHYVDPHRFTAFLIELYDIWAAHGDPNIKIRELDVLSNRIAGTPHRPCTLVGGCIGNYYLIEPDGAVAHCDLFLGDPAYTLGNVVRDDFATIRRSPRMQALQEANRASVAKMSDCPHFSVCNGWCPHERYVSVRHNPHHRAECCGLDDLISHMKARHDADPTVQQAQQEN